MPKTRAQHKRSLENPALCELLPIRDALDNVIVRTDGCYVAGFRMTGSLTYFADDEGRNENKEMLESLLRTIPEQSMRLQFRYEVVEGLNGLLGKYEDHRRTEAPSALGSGAAQNCSMEAERRLRGVPDSDCDAVCDLGPSQTSTTDGRGRRPDSKRRTSPRKASPCRCALA